VAGSSIACEERRVRRWASAETAWLRGGAAVGIFSPILFTMSSSCKVCGNQSTATSALPIGAMAAWPPLLDSEPQPLCLWCAGDEVCHRPSRWTAPNSQRPGRPRAPCTELHGTPACRGFSVETCDSDFIVPAGHYVGALLSFLGAGIGFIVTSKSLNRIDQACGLSSLPAVLDHFV